MPACWPMAKKFMCANDLRVGLFLREGDKARRPGMTKRRVVITGAGIVSCIGNDLATVEAALRDEHAAASRPCPKFTELGLRSQVAGVPTIDIEARIDRKQLRFMGDAAAYSQIALEDAIEQAGLTPEQVIAPAHRPDHGLGRRLARQPDRSRRHPARKRHPPRRPLPGHALHELHRLGLPGDQLQGQGHQLLHHLGLLHLGALHWRGGPANCLGPCRT